jgi:hypothetical protein
MLSNTSIQDIGHTAPAHYWEEARQVKEVRIHPDCNPGTKVRIHPDCNPDTRVRIHPY